eukprot:651315_1
MAQNNINHVIMKRNKSLQYYTKNLNKNHFRIDIINIFDFWDRRCPIVHQPNATPNSCKYGSNCMYCEQFKSHNHSEDVYYHLQHFSHPKEECKRSLQCHSFQRLQRHSYEPQDLCHMRLYNHPPRQRLTKLANAYSPFVFETDDEKQFELTSLNDPTNDEITEYKGDFAVPLIEEVKTNGFEDDLKGCHHEFFRWIHEKLEHPRHIAMGSPLNMGEIKLSQWEIGEYPVYSGINNVMLNQRGIKSGHFKSYVSASRNIDVARAFKGETGMLIEIESRKQFTCCDVSWISKFPNEQEILFAFYGTGTKWNAKLVNQTKDNQKIIISAQPQNA